MGFLFAYERYEGVYYEVLETGRIFDFSFGWGQCAKT